MESRSPRRVRKRSGTRSAVGMAPPRANAPIRLLIVVDATESSRRALRYVGRIAGGRGDIEVHLAHISGRLPPALLETGGSELPEREARIEAKLRADQQRWIAGADREAGRLLDRARAALERGGVPASRIRTCASSPLDVASVPDEVLALARDEGCRTIVVGHSAHAWFAGFGGGHLAEQLVRKASGDAVWVVD